jgi:hypothetical protein
MCGQNRKKLLSFLKLGDDEVWGVGMSGTSDLLACGIIGGRRVRRKKLL